MEEAPFFVAKERHFFDAGETFLPTRHLRSPAKHLFEFLSSMPSTVRQIIHFDMDAFYASVEVLDNPDLRGKPVIVGGGSLRGVVSAASYEARRYGVHSAMPIIAAQRRCPDCVFLPVRMRRYRQISGQIMAIFRQVTPLVEPLSVDEAFLDVTASQALYGSAPQIAAALKERIKNETGLTGSAGVATSKLVAKIASDLEKPDGLVIVPPGEEERFLEILPIGKLWGVGKVMREELEHLGIRTIGDLRRLNLPFLERKFGKLGNHLYLTSRGIDDREVETARETKSVGNEETFERDLLDTSEIKKEILALCNQVAARLRKYGLQGKTVTLKVKYHDFKQITRSLTLHQATDDQKILYETACGLLEKTKAGSNPIRLLGISVSHFDETPAAQLGLFEDKTPGRQRELNRALDDIAARYGRMAVRPAVFIEDDEEREEED